MKLSKLKRGQLKAALYGRPGSQAVLKVRSAHCVMISRDVCFSQVLGGRSYRTSRLVLTRPASGVEFELDV